MAAAKNRDEKTAESAAVLFDIDGTLADTNFLHVEAWSRAFWQCDLVVPAWRIQRAIGADSSKLLDMLLEEDVNDDRRALLTSLHRKNYDETTARIAPLPGARELVATLVGRGVHVVLATSAPQNELDVLLDVLDLGGSVHAVTSGADVSTAKPAPDLITIALERAGVSADRAIMLGDATWDVIAAERAGLASVGVLSGGTSEHDLREAGAVAVYDDAAAVLTGIDEGPLASLLS
ncbi:HAD family hydrolase [Rathayibacter rathayi]|uniref:HAD family hydrolase n=1 Tax=Rathayibacter rathayi TaxID=33887 RepID=UPI000CE71D68|nr:HAD family hydrolase [Rathayibacter rathayi]PPG71268.1 HAD family hydrolase [Rathayibacter rathayi]PPG78304.1 HAD family hydrolase [Rathayibacter rathayi]PPG89081.1 HAD family hydrolase [Rathayibacter rathayi]PPG98227.1 HAD family hydrolase [Rathayibacter rathayi]PPI78045.1 HAD family hydrolase [Rathayibacter rathayi]